MVGPETRTPTVALPSGARMPLLGFGTWRIRGDAAYGAVRHALDTGYHLDTATMYGNEEQVGQALRGRRALASTWWTCG